MNLGIRQLLATALVWLLIVATATMGELGSAGQSGYQEHSLQESLSVSPDVDDLLATMPMTNSHSGTCFACAGVSDIEQPQSVSWKLAAVVTTRRIPLPDRSVSPQIPPPRS